MLRVLIKILSHASKKKREREKKKKKKRRKKKKKKTEMLNDFTFRNLFIFLK